MEIALITVLIIVIICLTSFLFFILIDSGNIPAISMLVLLLAFTFALCFVITSETIPAIDVYRGKTTLVIKKETHGNVTIITDSIVEYKK